MKNTTLTIDTLLSYAPVNENLRESIQKDVDEKRRHLNRKIIVLDDDPTGTQTVHDIHVYTDWTEKSIRSGFEEEANLFFILTNSRSFSKQRTEEAHREIGESIAKIAKKMRRDYILISRSDSTLRGHYPLETETLRKAIEGSSDKRFDGEILLPFFVEGGRYTIGNVQYAQDGNMLIPAGETEFARDKTFGYYSSDLTQWCEEKTDGAYRAEAVTCISLDEIRSFDVEKITHKLMMVKNFGKVVVNAIDYGDIWIFLDAFLSTLEQGKEFMFRSAASLVKAISGMESQPLLDCRKVFSTAKSRGGIVIVGSHVQRTTEQISYLKTSGLPLKFIQFDQYRVLEEGGLTKEVARVSTEAEKEIEEGKSVIVYTRRKRLDLETDDPEQQLAVSTKISNAIVEVIRRLKVQPYFIIAKGGITSSDVATKALNIWRARVVGQIEPGVPVWLTGPESKFPQMPYVIFPGNVGAENTLYRILAKLVIG